MTGVPRRRGGDKLSAPEEDCVEAVLLSPNREEDTPITPVKKGEEGTVLTPDEKRNNDNNRRERRGRGRKERNRG